MWSCGGGLQSVAIGVLIIEGRLPRPDIAVIADTGREKQSTWDYLDSVLNPKLSAIGLQVQIIRATEWSYYHKTGHDVFNRQGTLQIPCFTDESGRVGKLPGFCSSAWKQEVIDRWLRSQGIKKSEVRKWIGYSANEQRRWVRGMQSGDYKRGLLRFPLAEDCRLTADECRFYVIEKAGWPPPPKSRCWMCPNQNNEEWGELTPVELKEARQFEIKLQQRDPHAWLHRSCKPINEVDFSAVDNSARPCESGACFL